MLVYPVAKINIGLFVTEKRNDGFHNLETIFYPLELSDVLEINQMEGASGKCFFQNTGIIIDCPVEQNLIIRAYRLLATDYFLPAIQIHLHKVIPFGAGLGGGSSDAAFTLTALNKYFDLGVSNEKLERYATMLGSDCAFFIKSIPAFASGRGELLEKLDLSLKNFRMVLIKPIGGVSTSEAYGGIHPHKATFDLRQISCLPVNEWRDRIVNDFEQTVFIRHPEIRTIKERLYTSGAVYASMTGSGSAVFGLFDEVVDIEGIFPDCFVWQG